MIDAPKKISILLASDYAILSDSLISIFKGTKDLKLIGSATTVEDLLVQLDKLRPQVLLVDVSIAGEKLSDLLSQIASYDARVLVINQDMNSAQTIEALRCGAHGVIERKTTPDLLCRCVRAVASGDIWVGRSVTKELVQFLRSPRGQFDASPNGADKKNSNAAGSASAESQFGLTKREIQIVNALVEAQTNKDIAETFRISEYTVKHHLTNIFDKLGVYNRVELALFAINHQLCDSAMATGFAGQSRTPALADVKSR